MKCQDTQRLAHAYLDFELDLMTSLDVEAHLAECSACSARHAQWRALRDLEARHLHFYSAPGALKQRVAAACGVTTAEGKRASMRPWQMATVVSISLIALAALLTSVVVPNFQPGASLMAAKPEEKMVYHIATSADATHALRNVSNHLAVSPNARVIVVAHNQGVDFLLRGATDRDGIAFDASVAQLMTRGVTFRICKNTLDRRNIGVDAVMPLVNMVPSGIAEISRLQTQEGYAYMKL